MAHPTAMHDILPLIDAALRGMVLALLLLLAGLLVRLRPRGAAAQAAVLLLLGLVVQVCSSAPAFETAVACRMQAPLVGVSVANAVGFWLFVRALFDDGFRWRPWQAAAWLFAFAVGTLNCGWLADQAPFLQATLRVLLRTVPLACALLAVHAAVQHWREDLVEQRRWLRVFVLVTGVIYTLIQLSLRLTATQGHLSDGAGLLDMLGLLVIAAGVVWRLVRLQPQNLFPAHLPSPQPAVQADLAGDGPPRAQPAAVEAPTAPPPPDAAEERLAADLQRLMGQERAYRAENLSVASLAARLAVPEYRLRRHINQRLGHRNFNAYVNGLRLAEAQAALADPAQREQPVLTLALEAGFQSIGPFNRAFKAATGLTPSEYRRQKLADS
jgi:AraC-like DNA-binding protein